ncbi:hypothetical protein H632_c338p0, partial [Helicosporidium sp. ATCC 50920]
FDELTRVVVRSRSQGRPSARVSVQRLLRLLSTPNRLYYKYNLYTVLSIFCGRRSFYLPVMKLLYWLAILAGASYYSVADGPGPVTSGQLAWKGAGVGLLALWAASRARSPPGHQIAWVLGLGALGDIILEGFGLVTGAVVFLAGHALAIRLYRANRLPGASWARRSQALALFLATPAVAWHLSRDAGVAAYSVGLGAMAGAAWLSRFPRVGMGALLFVLSDWAIFARMGPLAHSSLPNALIWPLYFAGQALIASGVVQSQ